MQNIDGSGVGIQHRLQILVAVRGLIEAAAAQLHAERFHAFAHHGGRDQAGAQALAGAAVIFALGLHPPHHAARAMHGGIERIAGQIMFDAFDNDADVSHGPADESFLAGKGRRSALAHHPTFFALMRFAPGEVVVIVNFIQNARAHQAGAFGAYPIPPGIGVTAGQMHAGQIIFPQRRLGGNHQRVHIHAVFGAAFFEKPARGFVSETARAEVNANPHPLLFVHQNIHVMVAAADGAELLAGHGFQRAHRVQLPGVVVKQFVVHRHAIFLADAEGEVFKNGVHNAANIAAHIGGLCIGQNGLVATSNVKADTGRADLVAVGHHAADGHGVALVVIGHQRHARSRARATLDLAQRVLFDGIAPNRNVINQTHSYGLSTRSLSYAAINDDPGAHVAMRD